MYDNNNYPNTNPASQDSSNYSNAGSGLQENNNYPNTNPASQDSNNYAGVNQAGQSDNSYYRRTYQGGSYTQGTTRSPYENRSGYYQRTDSGNGMGSINNAGGVNSTGNVSSAGSYRYSSTYSGVYAQAVQADQGKNKRKKKERKGSGSGYLKKALISVSLGLFFGVFAGLGLWGVQKLTGVSYGNSTQEEVSQLEETVSDKIVPEISKAEEEAEAKADAAVTQSGLHVTESITSSAIDVSEVAREVMPAIVSINNHYAEKMSWFGQEFVNEADASGSGIIVGQNDEELLIATNHHVIADTEKLTVQFVEGSEVEASVKGTDAKMDLAVIAVKISNIDSDTMKEIAVATLGDSDSLVVGEPAIAIGNSLGYGQSVTTGVISALNRTIELSDGASGTFIQTDAAINPGNSGGALLNIKGEVIGINSNKIGGSAVEGMGYAIPISSASPIIAELMLKETKNKVAEDERGYLGISGITVTEYVIQTYDMPEGVYISQVYENTAAAEAGLRKGDIITEFDGEQISSMDELQKELEFHAKGDTVELTVMSVSVNGYTERKVQVTLGNKVQN